MLINSRILGLSHSSETHHTTLNIRSINSQTASISQTTTTTQDIVRQLQESSLDTKNVVETMSSNLSGRLGLLNESFEVMLQATINSLRDQFIEELNSKARPLNSSSSPCGQLPYTKAHLCETRNNHIAVNSSQQLRRQVRYQRVYRVWFATITFTSKSTLTSQAFNSSGNIFSNVQKDTSSSIIINVRPRPWIALRGVLGFIDREVKGTTALRYKTELRMYNIIPRDSPIVKACETGDIASAQKLFAIGQASPFDVAIRSGRYKPGYYDHSTLLDLAINSWLQTLRKIESSKYSDFISDKIKVLKRKFELLAFLVDCGLDPGENMSLLPCTVSVIMQSACSSPLAATSPIGDMLRCLVTCSTSNPFDFYQGYEDNLFLASMDVIPEISSCMMGQESWPLPEPFTENGYNPRRTSYIVLSFTESAYNLLRDPTGIHTRVILKLIASTSNAETFLAGACLIILYQSQNLPDHESGAWDLAVRERLIACLELGMSPKDTYFEREISVAQFYLMKGKKQLLESALILIGWSQDTIDAMFDEEASALLVQALDSLRPVIAMSKAGSKLHCQSKYPSSSNYPSPASNYVKNRDLALSEGYQRYFPEEEQEILELVNDYDKYLPISGLPAINGITEDFWN